ncbi:glycosyltransferase family protein [Pinibacter aurantiacus]|uniref:Glycosyltransferase family 2 protein n=1 Tax=Pinibacter aurantiacus TaxID=2851599 RepID=A0A9E2SAH3_9BACT|nr:hypothetical protein [Pinibacter aurantiacus]MBV4359451.1 hypothetical protein [Pinibacter aurantiacus]
MNFKKRLAGVVILYNPDIEEVKKNIGSYSAELEKLWVIDNSEEGLIDPAIFSNSFLNVTFIQDGVNRGIGPRINYALEECRRNGFDWLLTMDQDSSFTFDNFSKYIETVRAININDSKIAQLGVEFSNEVRTPNEHVVLQEELAIITSGTFINIKCLNEVGLMNEDLFIDEVDSDFSYRIALAGWKTLVCKGIYLLHSLGTLKEGRSVKTGAKSLRTLHPPVRLYYMTRNHLLMKKKYKKHFPEVFKKRDIHLLHVYKNNLLYNLQKFKSLQMIIKGYFDFKRNKLGRLS